MAITPTYSWPLPDDTDLVKDGAEAIRDLGNAIDATVDGLPGAGLVHIETVSFSGLSSQSLDDIFSADYDSYKLIVTVTASTTSNLTARFRVGGADNSTASSYNFQYIRGGGSSAVAAELSLNLFDVGFGETNKSTSTVIITDPFLASQTNWVHSGGRSDRVQFASGYHNQNTSYTGISVFPNSGTFSGVISVYGFRKS
jgi:hypothetical protein